MLQIEFAFIKTITLTQSHIEHTHTGPRDQLSIQPGAVQLAV